MAAASPRATFSGSSLVRLLSDPGQAHAAGTDAADGRSAPPSFAERLGSWLDWTDAIALSAALSAGGAARPAAAPIQTPPGTAENVAEVAIAASAATAEACQRVRSDLVKLATADVAYTAAAASDTAVDFSPYRRDYLAHQRAMESAVTHLRAQVRAALTSQSPELARLAALDAVMDEALRQRERLLLATVPVWLEKHFDRLQQAHTGSDTDSTIGSDTGLDAETAARAAQGQDRHHRYHQRMQRVLLAELDLRLEPIEGMLEALRHETARTP